MSSGKAGNYSHASTRKKKSKTLLTNEKDRSKTIVHTVLANRMDKIEDSLPVLLESYSDAVFHVNEDGFLPIHAACSYYARNDKVIGTLKNAFPGGVRTPVESRPNPSKDKFIRKYSRAFPIHIALSNGASLQVVKILLDDNKDMVNTPDKHGLCPLIIALKHRAQADVIQYIISIDFVLVRNSDKRMNLPLHLACMYSCSADVISALYNAYPSAVNCMNRDGLKPLDLAQRSRDFSDKAINLLLEAAHEERKCTVIEVDALMKKSA